MYTVRHHLSKLITQCTFCFFERVIIEGESECRNEYTGLEFASLVEFSRQTLLHNAASNGPRFSQKATDTGKPDIRKTTKFTELLRSSGGRP